MRKSNVLMLCFTLICSTSLGLAQQSDDFDDPLGIGLLVFNFSDGQSFDLYNLYEDGSVSDYPFTTIVVSPGEMSLRPIASNGKEWKMFVMYEEWDLFHCICYRKLNEDYYVIEFDDEKVCCIQSDIGQFYDWNTYLQVVANGVYRRDQESNPLRETPTDEGINIEKKIKNQDYHMRPIQMQGEWIQVNIVEADCEDSKALATGWIKWRDGGELLIEITYIC